MMDDTIMDFERELIPIWEESPEVYYDPVILEHELDQVKKENAELKYECSELNAENKLLRTEINTKEKEKIDLHKKYKDYSIKLPKYQSKITEFNKEISMLTTDKKNLLLANRLSMEKRVEIEKKYKETTEQNTALIVVNQKLEKIIAKYKLEKAQEHKDKLRTKAENEIKKAKTDNLEIHIKTLQVQISQYEGELRSRDILATGLNRELKIHKTKFENALKKLSDSETHVKALERTIQDMNKECKDSKLKYSSLVHENNNLKAKLDEETQLKLTVEILRDNESGLKKQMNIFKRIIFTEQLENKKLIEIARELEKQKTKFIYTGEDITVIKKKLEECMEQNLILSKKFSNLDCPFYQSKHGKLEDEEPVIKCGSIKERHYENKIFALEQIIKTKQIKFDNQVKEQKKYRDVVVKSLYDTKKAKDSEKAAKVLLEKQKYEIIYNKLDVLGKDSKIQKLEIQMDSCDYQRKLANRQSTLLCRQVRNDYKKIYSMRKNSMRVNEIIKNVEKNKEELKYKAEHSEKCSDVMKRQLEYNKKCQKVQQLEANKMKSTVEEFQKKIFRMQEELNNSKRKNEELTNAFKQFQTDSELNYKIQVKNIKDAKSENTKLSIQKNELTLKLKRLSNTEEGYMELESKLKAVIRDLAYLQKKYDKLYLEKQKNVSLNRMPK
ncbi:uveal autoantigen with coiled-coil domains and ankyrin repeats protein-like [Metopolophium dirhodum]|uniref:uveal autoantigen with coiled-coil domains and ankyrin repeats protein-like n=1 Tax=Metopolophium dirhodum TaxID=44670 RepID=UPI00298FC926|nr:uveal autoantigen with coiled-coil domains and ankyrin repeats protein-like [Metopolophium dirhodum]